MDTSGARVFQHVFIANRGAAATRILRTVKRVGLKATVVYDEVDRDLPYVAQADHAMLLRGDNPRASYLAARCHPGSGDHPWHNTTSLPK